MPMVDARASSTRSSRFIAARCYLRSLVAALTSVWPVDDATVPAAISGAGEIAVTPREYSRCACVPPGSAGPTTPRDGLLAELWARYPDIEFPNLPNDGPSMPPGELR